MKIYMKKVKVILQKKNYIYVQEKKEKMKLVQLKH